MCRVGLNNIYKVRRCFNNKELKFFIYVNRFKFYNDLDYCLSFDLFCLDEFIDDVYYFLDFVIL